jgi:SAM-dependent methyltransferase
MREQLGPRPASERQAAHYNRIIAEYDAHYGDAASLEYRRRFFLEPLLSGLDLNELVIADLAAGSGHTTVALKAIYPRARIVGFDISPEAVYRYCRNTGCEGRVCDLTKGVHGEERFDAAIVVGGLHHCASFVPAILENIAHVLKPGGLLLMVEPNRETWFEPLRRIWYRRDRFFESSTEAALSHDELLSIARPWFDCLDVQWLGGAAYFLVYNSLVFRVPLRVKVVLAPMLLKLEAVTNKLPIRYLFPYFVARWRLRQNAGC